MSCQHASKLSLGSPNDIPVAALGSNCCMHARMHAFGRRIQHGTSMGASRTPVIPHMLASRCLQGVCNSDSWRVPVALECEVLLLVGVLHMVHCNTALDGANEVAGLVCTAQHNAEQHSTTQHRQHAVSGSAGARGKHLLLTWCFPPRTCSSKHAGQQRNPAGLPAHSCADAETSALSQPARFQ